MSNSKSKKPENNLTEEVVAQQRGSRSERRKVYERVKDSQIPDYLVEEFKTKGYDLRFVRWAILGKEDFRYLGRREREGYEFVTQDELPEEYIRTVRMRDTSMAKGLVTMGDLCLMKIDTDLANSRRDYFNDEADTMAEAVDIHTLEKKGFRNLGTKTRTMMREPSFKE